VPWEAVGAALGPRTRALLLNSPHNPSGAALHEADIAALRSLAARHPFLIISDEAYAYMVYDGRPHLSLARFPELAARAFVIFSFGKTLHATGWKVGYCLAPAALSAELRKIHQFATFSTATPFQQGIAAYLAARPEPLAALPAMYQAKRDLFRALMAGSRFEALDCEGAYFQLMRYDAISSEADQDFALRLIREQGVAAVPVSVFYEDRTDHRVLRFCFAKSEETLREAARRLCSL
jgi:methionine aminotransferase